MLSTPRLIRAAVILLVCGGLKAAPPERKDIDQMWRDVPAFSLPGWVPGLMRVDPSAATPLLMDRERQPFAAAGFSSAGRLVAFGHEGFLSAQEIQRLPGLQALLTNALRWAGRAEAPAVGLDPQLAGLETLLRGQEVRLIAASELERQVDVYCWAAHREIAETSLDRVRRFLLKGGGLVLVANPETPAGRYPDFRLFPANQIASLAGIEFLATGKAQVGDEVWSRPVPNSPDSN